MFSEKDRAALAWATELTANNRSARREVKDRLKRHLSDPEIVDLTLACCWFNFMNRFNDCLEVDIETDTDVPDALLQLMHETPPPHEIAAAIRAEEQPAGQGVSVNSQPEHNGGDGEQRLHD